MNKLKLTVFNRIFAAVLLAGAFILTSANPAFSIGVCYNFSAIPQLWSPSE